MWNKYHHLDGASRDSMNMCHILLRINTSSIFMNNVYKILILDEISSFQSYQLWNMTSQILIFSLSVTSQVDPNIYALNIFVDGQIIHQNQP